MKTFSPSQDAQRRSPGKSVYYFLKIEWDAPLGTKYYSERNFQPDPEIRVEPILTSFPDINRAMSLDVESKYAAGRARFTLLNLPTDEARLETQLDLIEPRGARVEAYMVFDRPGGVLTAADWTRLQVYVIDDYEIQTERIVIDAVDWLFPLMEKRIEKRITDNVYPDAPPASYGQVIPYIFGGVDDSPCPLVTGGKSTVLTRSIEADASFLPVADASPWVQPGILPGTVIVGSEEIRVTQAYAPSGGGHTLETAPNGRGYNGTTAQPHGCGETVRQQLCGESFEQRFEFLVARGCVKSVCNVRIGAVTLEHGADYSIQNHDRDGDAQPETYIELTGALPPAEQVSPVAEQMVRDGTAGGWSVNETTTARNAANAIDANEESCHATAATIAAPNNMRLALDFTGNLKGTIHQFDAAWLEIDYQAVPGESRIGPAIEVDWGSPKIYLARDGSDILVRDLKKPSPEDVIGYLDTTAVKLDLDPSTSLFDYIQAPSSSFEANLEYASGARTERLKVGGETLSIPIWRDAQQNGLAQEGKNYLAGESETAEAAELLLSAGQRPLTARCPRPHGVRSDGRLRALAVAFDGKSAPGNGTLWARLDLTIPGKISQPVTALVCLSETWTRARAEFPLPEGVYGEDLDRVRVGLRAVSATGAAAPCPLQFSYRNLQAQVDVLPEQQGARQNLTGRNEPIRNAQAVTASSRLTQKVSLGDYLNANHDAYPNGWEFFNGGVQVRIAADNALAGARILVYDVRFVFQQRAVTRQPMSEDEAQCLADVQGIAQADNLLEKPADVLQHLLGDENFLGLPPACYDLAALRALAPADWKFARRIDQPITLGDLFSQACWNAGLRWSWDGGRIRFSRIEAPPAVASVFDFDRAQMFAPVVKRFAPMELVFNQLGLYFHRQYARQGSFSRIAERGDVGSQSLPWGLRRRTLDAEWIREALTAQQLADQLLRVYAWRQTVAAIEGPLEWVGPELGDHVAVTDHDARLDQAPGVVVGASFPKPERTRYALAIVNQGIRVWTHDPEIYIEVHVGSGRMNFVIGGVLVAYLTSEGSFHVKNQFEIFWDAEGAEGGVPNVEEAAPIVWDDDDQAIWFCVRHDSIAGHPFMRASQLTADGTLRCAHCDQYDDLIAPRNLSEWGPEHELWPAPAHIYQQPVRERLLIFTVDRRRLHAALDNAPSPAHPDRSYGVLRCREFVEGL